MGECVRASRDVQKDPERVPTASCALALVENPSSRCTSRKQRIALSPLVDLPVIKEHRYIGPGSLMITQSERVLGVSTDRLAVVLRRKLFLGDQRSKFGQHCVRLIELGAPHM